MPKTLLSGIALALALGATPALTADNGIYLGGSIGQSGAKDDSVGFDADATGYKLILGWRFLDWLSVEGNYVDFGSGSDNVLGSRVKTEADGAIRVGRRVPTAGSGGPLCTRRGHRLERGRQVTQLPELR
jgi:hypothetical protein